MLVSKHKLLNSKPLSVSWVWYRERERESFVVAFDSENLATLLPTSVHFVHKLYNFNLNLSKINGGLEKRSRLESFSRPKPAN